MCPLEVRYLNYSSHSHFNLCRRVQCLGSVPIRLLTELFSLADHRCPPIINSE
ncbi:hypothetical protein DPMN_131310 [Dreissena polymorpha]|uniref:Uncharacterized protein n=1 Tax=Dreissena polymorpha TaxID=45954 RepID=A0A9D4H4D6_DREPO|nr:hypothetical protein DPMN_131310 [Dreissena polymorpha]